MGRLRTLGVSLLVTLGVFLYLSLPTLRTLFGPEVVLAAYAAVAVAAGGLTWSTLRRVSGWLEARTGPEADGGDDPVDADFLDPAAREADAHSADDAGGTGDAGTAAGSDASENGAGAGAGAGGSSDPDATPGDERYDGLVERELDQLREED